MTMESSIIGDEDLEEYNEQLQCLIASTEGTLPGSRGFGISPDVLDGTPGETLNKFAMSLQEKVEQFIPEIEVLNVSGQMSDLESTPDASSLNIKIHIGRRDTE